MAGQIFKKTTTKKIRFKVLINEQGECIRGIRSDINLAEAE